MTVAERFANYIAETEEEDLRPVNIDPFLPTLASSCPYAAATVDGGDTPL